MDIKNVQKVIKQTAGDAGKAVVEASRNTTLHMQVLRRIRSKSMRMK